MIAKLTGLLDSVGQDWAVVDVSGVGYLLYCSTRTLSRLPGRSEQVSLEVETHVREDHIHLYGFLEDAEREWFRFLLKVQGVGARAALAILSVLGPAELAAAIAGHDRKSITRAQGVGPKLADRILNELAGRTDVPEILPVAEAGDRDAGLLEEAVSVLVNLGYSRGSAYGAVVRELRSSGDEPSLEHLIRAGLKELGS